MFYLAYLKVSIALFAIWIIIFLIGRKQRKEMIIGGILGGITGPIQELWFTKDYWHPEYWGGWPWVEDIIFGFSIAGLAAVIYEVLFSFKIKEIKTQESHPFLGPSLFLITGLGMGLFVSFVNSIYAAILAFLLTWVITMFVRSDLFLPSLLSGFIIVIIMFLGYQIAIFRLPGIIQTWWDLNKISGILVAGVPLEEYVWFFAAGLALGPIYELWKGFKFVKR